MRDTRSARNPEIAVAPEAVRRRRLGAWLAIAACAGVPTAPGLAEAAPRYPMKTAQIVRTGPTGGADAAGSLAAGEAVALHCQAHGQSAGGSTRWDYVEYAVTGAPGTKKHGWVPDAAVNTGTTGPVPGVKQGGCTPAPVPRGDSMSEPVYLVHGYGNGTDCASRWQDAIGAWQSKGWRGPLHTVGYYAADRSCNTPIAAGTRETSIVELGKQLAWDIHRRYSRGRASVDIVGHSMGGLIARAAIAGVEHRWPGFPPYVYVEDAVTLGTPHAGVTAAWVRRCRSRQCVQLRPGSRLLRTLAEPQNHAPQARQGTDWTLIGAVDDATVAPRSALAMGAPHKVVYRGGQGVTHRRIASMWEHDRSYRLSYRNTRRGRAWRRSSRGRSPLFATGGAMRRTPNW